MSGGWIAVDKDWHWVGVTGGFGIGTVPRMYDTTFGSPPVIAGLRLGPRYGLQVSASAGDFSPAAVFAAQVAATVGYRFPNGLLLRGGAGDGSPFYQAVIPLPAGYEVVPSLFTGGGERGRAFAVSLRGNFFSRP